MFSDIINLLVKKMAKNACAVSCSLMASLRIALNKVLVLEMTTGEKETKNELLTISLMLKIQKNQRKRLTFRDIIKSKAGTLITTLFETAGRPLFKLFGLFDGALLRPDSFDRHYFCYESCPTLEVT